VPHYLIYDYNYITEPEKAMLITGTNDWNEAVEICNVGERCVVDTEQNRIAYSRRYQVAPARPLPLA